MGNSGTPTVEPSAPPVADLAVVFAAVLEVAARVVALAVKVVLGGCMQKEYLFCQTVCAVSDMCILPKGNIKKSMFFLKKKKHFFTYGSRTSPRTNLKVKI